MRPHTISNEQIIEINKLKAQTDLSWQQIADMYNLNKRSMFNACKYRKGVIDDKT